MLDIGSKEYLLLTPFINTLVHYEKFKGSLFLIKIIKEVRIALEAYFCNSFVPSCKYIRLNYSGIPVILKSAINIIKGGNTKFKTLVLSILTIGRSAV
jgi:hypothetical protein